MKQATQRREKLMNETAEQKSQRLTRRAAQKRKKLMNETAEERTERLSKQVAKRREKLRNETAEESSFLPAGEMNLIYLNIDLSSKDIRIAKIK